MLKQWKKEIVSLLYVFSGPDIKKFFSQEVGIHRWQRVPPTETKGRVHTSLITVAIIDHSKVKKVSLNAKELHITTTNGTGAGGQSRNRTYSCVIVKHIPTGIIVRCDKDRSQLKNKEIAILEVAKRVQDHYDSIKKEKINNNVKNQIGSGGRGEKIRTYNVKANRVTDHTTGKKVSLSKLMKGNLRLLF